MLINTRYILFIYCGHITHPARLSLKLTTRHPQLQNEVATCIKEDRAKIIFEIGVENRGYFVSRIGYEAECRRIMFDIAARKINRCWLKVKTIKIDRRRDPVAQVTASQIYNMVLNYKRQYGASRFRVHPRFL